MEEKELNTPNTETTNENLQQEEVQTENTENAETAAEEAHEPTIEEQLEAAQAEIAALNDKVLRQMAEFSHKRGRSRVSAYYGCIFADSLRCRPFGNATSATLLFEPILTSASLDYLYRPCFIHYRLVLNSFLFVVN